MTKETVWITGVQGFIGSNLAHYLSAQGYIVYGVGYGLFTKDSLSLRGLETKKVSESSLDELSKQSEIPKAVFHFAGGSSVGLSFAEPRKDFINTVKSTDVLLEWLRVNSPKTQVILSSSAAVYGASHDGVIPESAILHPYSPYGYHKFIAETICRSYYDNFGINSTIVRLFSVYGSGLRKQLIWDLCKKLQNGLEVELGGTGKETRDWIYIDDVVRCMQHIVEKDTEGFEVLNGATGIGTSISDVAEMVCKCWGGNVSLRFSGKSRQGDPKSLVADVSLLSSQGFCTSSSLVDGLSQTVNWFRKTEKC